MSAAEPEPMDTTPTEDTTQKPGSYHFYLCNSRNVNILM